MKTVFSGVRPSGVIHLGNYLGAIKNWVELQKNYQCIFCVVDYHAITTPFNPKELSQNTLETAATYLAAGIDPKKSLIFVQSHNSDHTELAWILNTISKISDLSRMRQFFDKSKIDDFDSIAGEISEHCKHSLDNIDKNILSQINNLPNSRSREIIGKTFADVAIKYLKKFFWTPFNKANVGLFDYPILMAADILLYNTDVVPVGEDQKQHVELARTLARRFNQQFGETFKIPESLVRKEGARIMGLDNPTKKMSKSANSAFNYIALTDAPDIIRDKIKKAVTDSGNRIKYNPQDKPAISNLLTIYSLVSDKSITELAEKYARHTSYAEFKKDLAEAIIIFLSPFQKKYNDLLAKPEYVKNILKQGAESAKKISNEVLTKAKNQIGII